MLCKYYKGQPRLKDITVKDNKEKIKIKIKKDRHRRKSQRRDCAKKSNLCAVSLFTNSCSPPPPQTGLMSCYHRTRLHWGESFKIPLMLLPPQFWLFSINLFMPSACMDLNSILQPSLPCHLPWERSRVTTDWGTKAASERKMLRVGEKSSAKESWLLPARFFWHFSGLYLRY